MSDAEVRTGGPGPCPVCEGSGRETIGPLTMVCHECGGDGQVGGDLEDAPQRKDGYRQPIDGEEYEPDVHGPLPAVWDQPVARGVPGCPMCLGAGVVINLGDIYRETTNTMVQLPCPRCRPRG